MASLLSQKQLYKGYKDSSRSSSEGRKQKSTNDTLRKLAVFLASVQNLMYFQQMTEVWCMEGQNDQIVESNRKKRFSASSCTHIFYLLSKKKSYGMCLEAR